jgi:hypothetical protein
MHFDVVYLLQKMHFPNYQWGARIFSPKAKAAATCTVSGNQTKVEVMRQARVVRNIMKK